MRRALGTSKRYMDVFRHTHNHLFQYRRLRAKHGQLSQQQIQPMMSSWASKMLETLSVTVKTQGADLSPTPAIFVGNHVSYIDICVLMSLQPVSFVAKAEVQKWPVFGQACQAANIVFVKRESQESRQAAGAAIAQFTREHKASIAIFPSGTTSIDEAKPWRKGAFAIAHQHKIPLQPFRIRYDKQRLAAYIDRDLFPWHLWKVLEEGGLHAQIEFHEPVMVQDPETDARRWWEWTRDIL